MQESVADDVLDRLKRRMATLRVGDPLDKNTDIGAINSAEQLARIRELSDIGEAEGAGRWSPPCELPDHGFWFPPTIFTGVSQAHRIAREEIFGPVLSVLTFRTPAEAVEKANNTPYGLSAGIWTDKGSRILWMADAAARRRGLGQHVQQVRPDQPVRRLQGVGLRPRGRPPRPGGLPERAEPAMTRIDVRKTYKLYIGGAFPRSESGRSYVVNDARGRFLANAALGLAQGRPRRGRRGAQGVRRAGPAGRRTTAARCSTGSPRCMEDRRPQFVDEVRQSEGGTAAAAGKTVDAAIDRLVWYAGWADKITQVVGNANPVAGPYFNLSTPEPTGVVAVLAPAGSSLLGLVSVVAPVIVTGNTAVVAASPDRPLPAITFAEVLATSDVPGGVVNLLTGPVADTAPTAGLPHGRQRDRPDRLAGDVEQATALEVAAAENLKRVRRARCRRAGLVRGPRTRADDRLPRDQDRLAPDRRLTRVNA